MTTAGSQHDTVRAQRAAPRSLPMLPQPVRDVLGTVGQPLDGATRAEMESRLSHDFGAVRIHAGAAAAEAARAVGALAFTVGRHVVLGDSAEGLAATNGGRGVLAHELAHVMQQGAVEVDVNRVPVGDPATSSEREAAHVADWVASPAEAVGRGAGCPAAPAVSPVGPVLQRQVAAPPPAPPPAPSVVTFSSDPAHVPSCGPLSARTDVAGVTWSLGAGSVAVDPATTIAANGAITIAPTQPAGDITVTATNVAGAFANALLPIRSHPTVITSTAMVRLAPSTTDYGAVFDHVFASADGAVASLAGVGVGERFIGIPTPQAATHDITGAANPFGGTFTLHTATLAADASNNWFLTAAGGLGGALDTVTISRAGINVGRFIQSASNPNPPQGLPASMDLVQGLHWFCPQAPAARRWTQFTTAGHSRTLRNVGGALQFVTTVNGVESPQTYDGPVGVFSATASPVNTPRTAAGAATPRTVAITVGTLPGALPTGAALAFSIAGPALGCTVAPNPANDHAAILTIGTTSGTVSVEAADATGVNRARVRVTIT